MYNVIGNAAKKEENLPEALKGNLQWLKDLYGEINSIKPISVLEKKKLEALLSDFNTEAENIGKLDSRTRELPHIQEYMKSKYNKSHIFDSSAGILGSQGNVKSWDNSGMQNSKPKIDLQNVNRFPKPLSPENGKNTTVNRVLEERAEKLANEYADHDMIIYGAKLYDEMH